MGMPQKTPSPMSPIPLPMAAGLVFTPSTKPVSAASCQRVAEDGQDGFFHSGRLGLEFR
jgi:hypothetical protein